MNDIKSTHGRRPEFFAPSTLAVAILLGACGDGGAADQSTSGVAASTSNDPTADPGGASSAEGSATAVDGGLLERVVVALGGEQALVGLGSVSLQVRGQRWLSSEGVTPDGSGLPTSDYTAVVSIDIGADAMRIEQERMLSVGIPLSYSEIVAGKLGYVDGVDNLWSAPGGAMGSDRAASTVRQQRLFNPQLLIRDALTLPLSTAELGLQEYNGRPHELLEIEGTVRPFVLWIDSETALISRLTTLESNPLWRDVEVEVVFSEWSPRAGDVLFPKALTLSIHGQILAQEIRDAVTGGVALDPKLFVLPDAGEYVAADAERGERNHGFLQERFSLGIPLDIEQTFVSPSELAPGIWHLTGGTHHSMVVQQSNGLVLIETPLAESRCLALLDWIAAEFPGATVSHAVVSHLTVDHAACARTLVALGATLVVGEAAEAVWADILVAASTVDPDALESSPIADPPIVLVAPDAGVSLEDMLRPVMIYGMPNPLSTDFVLPYVGEFAFVNDLFNPGQTTPAGPAGAQAILDVLVQHGLIEQTTALVGGHGGTASIAELQAAANG